MSRVTESDLTMNWGEHPTNPRFICIDGRSDAVVHLRPNHKGEYLYQARKFYAYAASVLEAQLWVETALEWMADNPRKSFAKYLGLT